MSVLQLDPVNSQPRVMTSSFSLPHSSQDGPTKKKLKYLDEVKKVQTDDFRKLAEKAGKAPPKYATPQEEVRITGLFRGQTLQQYASDYVNCIVPLVFNKRCSVRTGLRKKAFLKASRMSQRS